MIGYDRLYIANSNWRLGTDVSRKNPIIPKNVVVIRIAALNAKLQPFGSLDTHIFSALQLTETQVWLILNDSMDLLISP